jgi:rubredoxin
MIKRTQGIIIDFLQQHGEATKHQMAEACSRTIDTIHKTIARMKERRRVYIVRYIQANANHWNVVPVFALGSDEDAPPPAKTNCAKSAFEESDALTEYRTCRVCGDQKPLTNKYFPYYNKTAGQFSNRCKSCLRADNIRRRDLGLQKRETVFQREIPGVIVRRDTDHGTTLVRFGDQWRPSRVEPRRLPAMFGYSSGFEK